MSACLLYSEDVHAAEYDTLATFTTAFDPSEARAINVNVASERINGVIVAPGETFSFNKTILPRTVENGYVYGPSFLGGQIVNSMGGGICQVSSTLYVSLLYSGMKITERHPHSQPVTYVPVGYDATISGNQLDLRFLNTYNKPVMIASTVDNSTGQVTVTLLKERD
jgi:vancomycin resistance protein YoaR